MVASYACFNKVLWQNFGWKHLKTLLFRSLILKPTESPLDSLKYSARDF